MPRRSASSRPASLPCLRWSLSWAFRLDPAPGGGAQECQSRSGSALAWSSFNSQLTNPNNMDNNTPSFAERIAALKAAAETVMLEAQRMEAAARKFDKRRQQKASR
jgi:hypothetical protein